MFSLTYYKHAIFLGSLVVATGCNVTQEQAQPENAHASVVQTCEDAVWRETRLFLGMGGQDGGALVTDFELMEFIDEAVTPEFSNGYTLMRGTGAWLPTDAQQMTGEPSAILMMLHPPEPQITDRIHEIGKRYIAHFQQPASLISWTDHCTKLILADAG